MGHVTAEEQLDRLREISEACPACRPGEAESVADEDLPHWLRTHGVDPDTLLTGTPEQLAEWQRTYKVVMTIGG